MAFLDISSVSKVFGRLAVLNDVNLSIERGEFVVFVGPSGCGKSTLLRMISGLEGITSGTISIDGEIVNDVEPAQRGTAMVFQSYALYPHMTTFQNVSFGLRMAHRPRDVILAKVREAAAILRLDKLLERKPGQLSGGQKQRVAIGRAIVREPRVFLFDEPLSNLDAKLRVAMRAEIKALHLRLKTTTVYVTHDQVEAMTMADRIVVMRDGVIEQIGAPLELYDHPRNLFVAQFIGSPAMNVIAGKLRRAGANAVVETQDGIRWPVLREPAASEGLDVSYGVRPEHLAVVERGSTGSVPGEVVVVEPTGAETELLVRSGTSDISVISRGRANIGPGDQIALRVMPGSVHLFDQKSGSRIADVVERM